MRVALRLDGEEVNGALQSAPNAIGVCVVRVHEENHQRHVSRLRPLDEKARSLLAGGDKFVSRDPETIIDRISDHQQIERPKDWSIDDLELLRIYVLRTQVASARGPQRGKRGERSHRLLAALTVVKQWLKQSRMNQTAQDANLSEEESKDPICLLRAAKTAIAKLTSLYHEETGKDAPEAERRLIGTINNYLVHYAKPSELHATQERKMRTLSQFESDARKAHEAERNRVLEYHRRFLEELAAKDIPLFGGKSPFGDSSRVGNIRMETRADIKAAKGKFFGIACDHCGTELYNRQPHMQTASVPPQVRIDCAGCGWNGNVRK